MESSTQTRKSNHKATAALLAVLSGIFSIMMLTASPAGAETPIPFPVPSPELGTPIDPLFPVLAPTGRVDVSCSSETATAKLNNPTFNFIFGISIKVDGVVVETGTVGPNQSLAEVFDIAEDETKTVVIKAGTKTYFNDDVTRDCLFNVPLPVFEAADLEAFDPGLVFPVALPKGRVDVSCSNETATAKFNNPTSNFIFGVKLKVDGVTVKQGTVAPNQQLSATFDLDENDTKRVVVSAGATKYFDDDVTRDCRLPDPSYQVLQNCVTEQAHARLINNGDDTAMMGVDYPGDANALQAVAANSSIDWLLEVSPGESIDFTVRHAGGVLGNETLSFDCAQPEPTPTPDPTPTPEPTPTPDPTPTPTPTPEGPAPTPVNDPTPSSPSPQSGSSVDSGKQISEPPVPTVPVGSDADGGSATGLNGEGDSGSEGLATADIGSDGDEIIETAVAGSTASAGESGQRGSNMKIYLAILWGVVLLIGAVLVFVTMRRRSAVAFS